MTPPTPEQITALEQWARDRGARGLDLAMMEATVALCETVREMQTELAESTRFTLRSGVEKFKQQQSVDAALARAEKAEREHQEYRDENARLRQALSQYQQPGALVRYGVQHTPDPWLLKPMEDGYWTPWHIANADVARLTAERDAARAEVAQARVERDEARLSNTVTEHHTIQQLSAALTEARRVLRIAEWGKRDGWCRVCHKFEDEGHAPDCAIAAVLAQEEPS